MNTRILDLIKNPEIIQKQDLELLTSEVKKHPYLQNIRALHLIGTHLHDSLNYQKFLSVTAAYTTDKKILYHLINKKTAPILTENKVEKSSPELNSENQELSKSVFEEIPFVPKVEIKPVFVEGNLNRILFEGEEDFLERESEKIDLESTLESGVIVTHSLIKNEENLLKSSENHSDLENTSVFAPETIINEDSIKKEEEIIYDSGEMSFHGVEEIQMTEKDTAVLESKFEETNDAETFTPEIIIKEEKIEEEKILIEDLSKISFHGEAEFLPKVKIISEVKLEKYEVPKMQLSKQEEEMQRLIAQVQAKIKASKKEKISETETTDNHDINFSESQKLEKPTNTFEPEKVLKESKPLPQVLVEKIENHFQSENLITEKKEETESSGWKPMNFSGNIPDSLLTKKQENSVEEKKPLEEKPLEEKALSEAKTDSAKTEERPVFNASFFTAQVSSTEAEPKSEIQNKIEIAIKAEDQLIDSNIPVFINTWQKWLKIERKEEVIEEKPIISKVEVKNTVIEKFIEKEPKISKLKEESDFVVKEKGSNISHLMTETLAKLYIEQKLYAKAIKAYETLIAKHPLKEELFKEKIREIKEIRKNPI